MAAPDQFIKDLFREETAAATGNRVQFEVPPEVATRALTPDGRLSRAVASGQLASLPPPLCTLRGEALVDFKMPGDHVDRSALARADLRRAARWVSLLEEAQGARTPDAAVVLDPRDFATWVVAPHWPRWIEADVRRGVLTVEDVGQGCRRIGPHDHDVLWIAANELPLRVELLPFLFVRSGRPLVELLLWAETVRGSRLGGRRATNPPDGRRAVRGSPRPDRPGGATAHPPQGAAPLAGAGPRGGG